MSARNRRDKLGSIEHGFRFSPRPNRAGEISWREWSEEAFQVAKKEGKPILLDIGAFWCHWCHVMDETTYSDPEVIRLINEHFIPVRVDTDKRPDVNRRYNQGGWPTTAFLTPEGELLTGSTYITPVRMRQSLAEVRDQYHANREVIDVAASEMHRLEHAKPAKAVPGDLAETVVNAIAEIIERAYDSIYGGFGREPKFPQVAALEFALDRSSRTTEGEWDNIFRKTLLAMASSELFDSVAGGFFRYATKRNWTKPHYEKMLEDNAALLRVYLLAFQATGESDFRDVSLRIIEYLESTLYDRRTGGFFGSQDADEEYYGSSKAQRAKMKAPAVDKVLYTDWNAQAASSYLVACQALRAPQHLGTAVKVLDFLWDRCFAEEIGMHHFWDGHPHLEGVLNDQVSTLWALLDAYETTGHSIHLERALKVAGIVEGDYHDSAEGGFFDISRRRANLGELRVREKFVVDNAIAGDAFLKLHRLTGNERYYELARSALGIWAGDYRRYGLFAARYGLAVSHFLRPPIVVNIVGPRADTRTQELQQAALEVYMPDRTIRVLDPIRDAAALAEMGYDTMRSPVAFVCHDALCYPPVDQAEALSGLLGGLRR